MKRAVLKTEIASGGFTMAEILVVVVIVSLIATATGGVYIGTYKKMQLDRSVNELMLAAKYARLTAIEKQTECKLVLDKKQGKFAVVYKETDAESGQKADMIVSNPYSRPGSFPESVFFKGIEIVRAIPLDSEKENELENIIVFTPYGTADNAVIKVANKKMIHTIVISAATGKAKIFKGKDEELKADIVDLDAAGQ